jgi:hypothetical protein
MPYICISGVWPDYGRGPLDHVSKLRFSVFSSSPWNFWSKEHNHAIYWKFGTLAGLRSRPQAQMTMSPIQKTFLMLRPLERALTCVILIAGTQVMLRKAYFLRRGFWLRPESWTPRPLNQNSGPYYWDAHTNGLMCKISKKCIFFFFLQQTHFKNKLFFPPLVRLGVLFE